MEREKRPIKGTGPIICPKCKATTSGRYAFCPECGEPLNIACPNCGLTWRFWRKVDYCPSCGVKIPPKSQIRTPQGWG